MPARATTPVPQLAPFDLDLLEIDPATICALDATLRIIYVNRAWRDFGQVNGASWSDERWTGASVLDAIPPASRTFYANLFDEARRSDAPLEHSYECSGPNAFRRFRMRVLRCREGGLLVVHSLSEEHPGTQPGGPAFDALYRSANGLLTQCAHCRRVRRPSPAGNEWAWVPAWVARIPPNTSHGICALCERYFFPD